MKTQTWWKPWPRELLPKAHPGWRCAALGSLFFSLVSTTQMEPRYFAICFSSTQWCMLDSFPASLNHGRRQLLLLIIRVIADDYHESLVQLQLLAVSGVSFAFWYITSSPPIPTPTPFWRPAALWQTPFSFLSRASLQTLKGFLIWCVSPESEIHLHLFEAFLTIIISCAWSYWFRRKKTDPKRQSQARPSSSWKILTCFCLSPESPVAPAGLLTWNMGWSRVVTKVPFSSLFLKEHFERRFCILPQLQRI